MFTACIPLLTASAVEAGLGAVRGTLISQAKWLLHSQRRAEENRTHDE